MAPPQRYPSPAKQMVELGRQARREALTFDEFWERAVRPGLPPMTTRKLGQDPDSVPPTAIVWPSDTADRADAQEAMTACREVWRRAYLQLPPTKADLAFVALHSMLTEQDVGGNDVGADVPLAAA